MRKFNLASYKTLIAVILLVVTPIAWCEAAIVTILPIQIGDGNGGFANSDKELYLAATNKIWSQAGISFNYLPFTSIISTFFKLENQGEVDDLFAQLPKRQ
ncbi:MAG: hypothetical protein R3C56_06570 [Pirellulaceae bacterium]